MITEQKKIDLPRFSDMANSFSKSGDLSLALVERTESLRAALTRIEELTEQVEKMPKWISVKERLPEEGQDILYVVDGLDYENPWVQHGIREWDGEAWFWCDKDGDAGPDGNDGEHSHVTHWMAVPSPPAEGDQG